ncbi:MAG: Gfo/Idh/MocA family oxidoreductase [Magnetococcales bacterium]|nr:Gfo/Idh/MocA family oxidoreductase [Magnetococcales bacterium]NGZ28844.1 Gfo/Idh/MocA family oxidoreductase [Magnetococcales bacterium]
MRVGVVGYGYWGPNLVRNVASQRAMILAMVADGKEERRQKVREAYPHLSVVADGEELVTNPLLDAVIIATPVATHYPLAKLALEHGKHVLVEKPLCISSEQARDLIALANKVGKTLMVDHTFLFSPPVTAIHKILGSGNLGELTYYDSTRINLGLFQSDVNVLWDLAPHDLAIMDYLIGEQPVAVEASGFAHFHPERLDIAYMTLHFASRKMAHFNLSWMSPTKVRRVILGGSRQMLVWDDLQQAEKIKIYNSGVEFMNDDQRYELTPGYRIGDIYSPQVGQKEALAGVMDHFVQVSRGQTPSLMDGEAALRVILILEEAQQKLMAEQTRLSRLYRGNHP